jgi:mycothiol synthase
VAEGTVLPRELRDGEQLFAERGGNLVGYAHLDARGDAFGHAVAELFAAPASRGEGVGTALAREVFRRLGDRGLRFWSHGDDGAAAALADRLGLRRVRELVRMHARLDRGEPEAPALPGDVRIRAFSPGADEAAVVRVNGRAFAAHPEQGGMTEADVRADERESWFDPAGFLLAVDAEDRLLGFHWIKVHEAVVADPSGRPIGEVYVIAVDPDVHGRGLGTTLLTAGLRHLRQAGLSRAMLYVESENAAAIRMYEAVGFRRWDADVQYAG